MSDELVATYSTESFQPQRLQQKELVRLKAFKPASSTRASQDQLDAWKSTRTSHSSNPTSLLSIFILMVSIFLSNSFPFSFLSNSFTDCWDLELAEQHEFATNLWAEELEKDELFGTCWEKEIEKHNELPNLLWDHELEELLTNKPFQLDQLQEYNQYKQQHDQLEENNDWSIQLQQNLSENEKNKKSEKKKKKLETNNEFHQSFENMILKKLVALLLEKHFASAASFQLNGNKAWKKFREASKEIIFNKTMRDKELPHQLRREQLDCKDLRSASFRALCPSSFEQNSFKEETFTEETFTEKSFADSSLEQSSLTKSSLTREHHDSRAASQRAASQRAPSKSRPSRKRPSKKRPSQKRASKTAA